MFVLGLLAGLVMGLATAAFDGARRTSTALDRLATRTTASDAVVFGSQVGVWKPDWPKLARHPEVTAIGRWALLFGEINGTFGGPIFGAIDDGYLGEVDRPMVIKGRMFDPKASDEMIVDEDQVKVIPLGSTVTFTAESIRAGVPFTGKPTGPTVKFRVVGVVRNLPKLVFTNGYAMVSPGYVARYRDEIFIAENANVRLAPDADVNELRATASRELAAGIPVLDLRGASRRVRTTTDVERTMLVLLAGVLLIAGIVLVGQALLRSAASIGTDAPTLRAMGITRRELVRAGTAPHALVLVVAMITTTTTAVVASRWFPVGYAATVDPDRGIRVDAPLLLASTCILAGGLVGVVFWAAWRSTAPGVTMPQTQPGRIRTWLRRRRPVSVSLGVSMATEWRSGRNRTGAAAALVGATAAVTGVVAMFNVNRGVNEALGHPERAGVVWDATIVANVQNKGLRGAKQSLVDDVADQRDVVAVASVLRSLMKIDGIESRTAGVATYTVLGQPGKAPIRFSIAKGRHPEAPREIVLGPSTAATLGVSQGDEVRLADGTECVVVGIALFPNDIHSAFDEGALLAPDQFFSLQRNQKIPAEANDALIVARLAPGDREKQLAALGQLTADRAESVEPADVPRELTNLRNIRSLPLFLAGFLALLGIAAIGHSLFSSVRHRYRDFAVLRALGLSRRGTVALVVSHASSVAGVGLVLGVPAGILAGRAGWQQITERVPLRFVTPIALIGLAVVVPVAVAVVNILAAVPSRVASRVNPALVLRSE